ncbi:MAG: hypothetical protein V1827_06480 [Candidatus Micrarchaeota archaeon]
MVQLASQTPPLTEGIRAFDENRALVDLMSPDPKVRERAAGDLKVFGNQDTAMRLEDMLLGSNVGRDQKAPLRDALMGLSHKYMEYLYDSAKRARRMKALSASLTGRTLTPPHGIKALQRS